MRNVLLALAIVAAGSPVANAQGLKVPEIIKSIPGVWGWAAKSGPWSQRSCENGPMRIWLEDGGKTYKSQAIGDTEIYESKVGIAAGKPASEQTFIMIKYSSHVQRDMFGLQIVWSLTMPDEDHFVWRQLPLGGKIPPLERCEEKQEIG